MTDDVTDPDKIDSFEDVLNMVGTKGLYNVMVIITCTTVALVSPMQTLSAGLLGETPPHWCHVEELIQANWTTQQIRNFANPENHSCIILDYNYTTAAALSYEKVMEDPTLVVGGTGNKTCTRRDFEEGVSSIVTEFDLVCDRLALYSTTIAAAQIGRLIGSLVFGYILGRIGRRIGMLICIVMYLLSGLLVAASVNVYMYIVCRICVTMFGMGMYLGGFVLTMELCTPSLRSLVSSYFVLPWAVGSMITAGIAYGIRPWRYMQVALSLPTVLVFINFFVTPESPRWLNQRGRNQEALRVLSKIAKHNKRELPTDEKMIEILERIHAAEENKSDTGEMSWIQTWIIPQIQWITPIVFFCWFSVSMVYYGVSLGAANFGINEQLFIFLGGGLEIISCSLIWPGITYIGRRVCLAAAFIMTAFSLFGVMGLQIAGYDGDTAGILFFSFAGKFTISACFHIAYIVTGELFETNLRTLMIGEASVCARLGSSLSPFITVMVGGGTKWAPSAFFGSFAIVSGLMALLLPETNNMALDSRNSKETIEAKEEISSVSHAVIRGASNEAFEMENSAALRTAKKTS